MIYSFSYLEPVCCSMSSSNCCFLTCIQVFQEAGQVVWYSHLFQNFPPYDPAIPLLGMYPEETKTEKDIYIPLFIAALFTIARTWKQPRCPSTDEWIKKLWYIYTMEYFSAIKRNVFESVSNEVGEPKAYYTE